MGYFSRLFSTLTGKSKSRLPEEMAILDAPQDLLARVRSSGEDQQEEAFIEFVRGKHGCMIDWRARRDEIYEELLPLLSVEERKLLPAKDSLPEQAATVIVRIRASLSGGPRALVHTESFGDFSFLILVPREREQDFARVVGPWLIEDEE